MTIKISGHDTLNALSKIKSVLGTELTNVSVKLTGGSMLLGAAGANLALRIEVPNCEGKAKFCVNASSLQHILSQRDYIEGTISDSEFSFKRKNYKGKLAIFPYLEIEVEADKSENPVRIPFNSGIAKHFNAARKSLALSSVLNPDKPSFLCVKVEKGEIVCAVYDEIHAGVYRAPVEYDGKLEFNILDDTLRKILSMTDKSEDYDLTIGDSTVYVETSTTKASLTMTQMEAKQFGMLLQLFEQAKQNIAAKAQVDSEHIGNLVDNMMAIAEAGKFITLAVVKDGLHMKYTTSYGEVEETIKAKVKGAKKIGLTPDVLMDLTGVLPAGEIIVGVSVSKRANKEIMQLMLMAEKSNVAYTMSAIK